jgi:hypothetical protein
MRLRPSSRPGHRYVRQIKSPSMTMTSSPHSGFQTGLQADGGHRGAGGVVGGIGQDLGGTTWKLGSRGNGGDQVQVGSSALRTARIPAVPARHLCFPYEEGERGLATNGPSFFAASRRHRTLCVVSLWTAITNTVCRSLQRPRAGGGDASRGLIAGPARVHFDLSLGTARHYRAQVPDLSPIGTSDGRTF